MDVKLLFILSLIVTFALTALLLRVLIPVLKSHKMGQKILDIGPRWHKSKEGTPTMGGIAFYIAAILVGATAITFASLEGMLTNLPALLITCGMALLSGVIGFLDDYTKFLKKQNEGLKAWQKYLLQLILSIAYLILMHRLGGLSTSLHIPFLNASIELGIVYDIFAVILMTGIINSVNLADGIDGLCASETAIVGAFFAIVALLMGNTEAGILSALLIGSCLGFLTYNWNPARIFMGDTGSLFLGGTVVGLAFLIDSPAIVLICGFMYVLEAISDILQILWVKTRGHRLFLMAPIHHHFEKKGWSEIKIVFIFSLATLLLCALSFLGLPLL